MKKFTGVLLLCSVLIIIGGILAVNSIDGWKELIGAATMVFIVYVFFGDNE